MNDLRNVITDGSFLNARGVRVFTQMRAFESVRCATDYFGEPANYQRGLFWPCWRYVILFSFQRLSLVSGLTKASRLRCVSVLLQGLASSLRSVVFVVTIQQKRCFKITTIVVVVVAIGLHIITYGSLFIESLLEQ